MDYIYSSVLITVFAVVISLGKGQDSQAQEIQLEGGYVYHTFQDLAENVHSEDLVNKAEDYLTGDGPIEDHAYQFSGVTMKVMNYHITDNTVKGSDIYPTVSMTQAYAYQEGVTDGLAHQKTEEAIEGHEYQTEDGNAEGYAFHPMEIDTADYDIAPDTNVEYSWKPYINIGDGYQADVDPYQEFEYEMQKQGLLDDSDDTAGDDYSEGQTMEISDTIYDENLVPAFAGIDTAFDFQKIVPTTLSTLPTVDDGFEDERIKDYRERVRNYLKQLSEENGRIIDVNINKRLGDARDKKESESKDSEKLGDTSHKLKKNPESAVEQISSFFHAVGDNVGNIMLHIYETFISIFHQET